MKRSNPYRIESVDRALAILTILGRGEPVSITEAQRELDVSASTVHRIMSTLVAADYATQDSDRKYCAGPALLEPGQRATKESLPVVLKPYLEALSHAVDETVGVWAAVGDYASIVQCANVDHMLSVQLTTGQTCPIHECPAGRMILEWRDAKDDGEILIDVTPTEADGVVIVTASVGNLYGYELALGVCVPAARYTSERAETVAAGLRTGIAWMRAVLKVG